MLTPDILADIPAWTQNDLYQAQQAYYASHPDPTGAANDQSVAALIEMRWLDIFSQKLNTQLAASTLLPGGLTDMAGRLAAFFAKADLANLTTEVPSPVDPANFRLGEVLMDLAGSISSAPSFPAFLVSQSNPEGTDITRASLGPVNEERFTLFFAYLLPYKGPVVQQIKAQRGAEAIRAIARGYTNDPLGMWQDGKVEQYSRIAPMINATQPLLMGMVRFSCKVRTPFQPNFRS